MLKEQILSGIGEDPD